ncbi:hypothetical protein C882_3037 [Caenispirillum salinarum AK4]|uniref:Spermidine synthase n=1 Tax=Caenispirillum salinarum AK4 TaxID=1238182 RepID=K9HNR1_9PROT|nr:hypothetical protein [Caenispirillum salinarum]EKV31973.1 hypothetical protein C882_3037 [Caenispirillum salinarum AK4]
MTADRATSAAATPRPYSLDAARDMRALYGFGLFPLPDYRPARVGPWRLERHRGSLAHGYVTRAVVEPVRWVLYRDRVPWMSTGVMEQESHAWHVHRARGTVVVFGLGMGMYVHAAAAKPEVERVVVVDNAPDVQAVLRAATDLDAWKGREKITLVEADALDAATPEHLRTVLAGARPDVLYADIWPTYPDAGAPAQTAALAAALQPGEAGWWGQEISFALWAHRQGGGTLEDYAAAVGVPLAVGDGYRAFCRDAAAIHDIAALAGDRPSLGQRLKRLLGLGGRG